MESKVFKIVEILKEAGVSKTTATDILQELIVNNGKYAGNKDAINELLIDKLDIDTYIRLFSTFIL